MNRVTTRKLAQELEIAAKAIAKKYGFEANLKNSRFDPQGSSLTTIEFFAQGASQLEVDFEKYAQLFGLKPEWLNTTFKSGHETFTIVGLKASNKKYPVIAKNAKGSLFKFPANQVKLAKSAK